jgi:hypothetical protein
MRSLDSFMAFQPNRVLANRGDMAQAVDDPALEAGPVDVPAMPR